MPLNAADPGKAQLQGEMAPLQKAARAKACRGKEGLVPSRDGFTPGREGSILQHWPGSVQREAWTTF